MTTNRKSLAAATMGSIFPLFLAVACLPEPAAATVIYGSANGPVTCTSNDVCTAVTPLPVGPGPGGGSAINPRNYGMCGLLRLAGAFENSTTARIIVAADGYYAVERIWKGSALAGPAVDWTCVHFTDFSGLPPVSDGFAFQAPVVTASGGGFATNNVGGIGDACIWAGLTGGLSAGNKPSSVSAQYDTLYTQDSAQTAPGNTLSTYAFCTAFKGFSFNHYWYALTSNHYWYALTSPGNGSTGGLPVALSFVPARAFCYMDGVGNSEGGAFRSAGLGILGTGQYAFDVGNDSQLWFNCLSLTQ